MITVPVSLKQEIEKLRGRRLKARVRIDYSDANIDNTIEAGASSISRNSYYNQTYNGKEDVSKKWLSLDGYCVLDGTYFLSPETPREQQQYEIGWWGTEISNQQCDFLTPKTNLFKHRILGDKLFTKKEYKPALFVSFIPRTFSDVRISFDNARMEYAIDFDIEVYDNSQSLLYKEEVRGNGGVKYVITIPVQENVALVKIIVLKWSNDNTCAKIAELYTSISELYEGSDILTIQVVENRELSDSGIPLGTTASGQCVISLVNKNRAFDYTNKSSKLYNVIREGNRISPEIGDGENWIPLGVFYSKAWDISRRSLSVTVTGLDRMETLGQSEYKTNKIIQSPGDENYLIDTTSEWDAGIKQNMEAVDNKIRMVF